MSNKMKWVLYYFDYVFYRMSMSYKKHKMLNPTYKAKMCVLMLLGIGLTCVLNFISDLLGVSGLDNPRNFVRDYMSYGYLIVLFLYVIKRYNTKYIEVIRKRYQGNPLNKSIGPNSIFFLTLLIALFLCMGYRNHFHYYIVDWGLYGKLSWMIDWMWQL